MQFTAGAYITKTRVSAMFMHFLQHGYWYSLQIVLTLIVLLVFTLHK